MTPVTIPLRLPIARYAVAASICMPLGGWLLFQSAGGHALQAGLAGRMTATSTTIARVFTGVPQVLGVWPVAFAWGAFIAGIGVVVVWGLRKRDRVLRLDDELVEWDTLVPGRRIRVPIREIIGVEVNGPGDHLVIRSASKRRVIPADWFPLEAGGLAGALRTVASHVEDRSSKKPGR